MKTLQRVKLPLAIAGVVLLLAVLVTRIAQLPVGTLVDLKVKQPVEEWFTVGEVHAVRWKVSAEVGLCRMVIREQGGRILLNVQIESGTKEGLWVPPRAGTYKLEASVLPGGTAHIVLLRVLWLNTKFIYIAAALLTIAALIHTLPLLEKHVIRERPPTFPELWKTQ